MSDPPRYKVRMPVLERTCANCGYDRVSHMDDGKCFFQASHFAPGGMSVKRKTVQLHTKEKEQK